MSDNLQEQAHSSNFTPPPVLHPILSSSRQFGVTLFYIKYLNVDMVDGIPPIVRQCVEYLSTPEALQTENIFLILVDLRVIEELRYKCNRGEEITFHNNPHIAANLLMSFFSDLEEPILTFDLYAEIIHWSRRSQGKRQKIAKSLIQEDLPEDNYIILKYLITFLCKVIQKRNINKMSVTTLAIAIGSKLAWEFLGTWDIRDIAHLDCFVAYLLINHKAIFIN